MACSAPTPAAGPQSGPTGARPSHAGVQIAGHRGAKGIAPENTLVSFQVAMDLGVDMLELDVHLSKDNELVVMHDPSVVRTTDGAGQIGDFTVAELKQLNAAAKFSGEKSYGTRQVPTLQEVYDLVNGRVPINVEIKQRGDGSRYAGIEQKVVELIRQNGALASTVVSSFDFPTLTDVHALEPQLATYAIISTAYFKEMGLRGKGPKDVAADMVAHNFRWVAVDKLFMTPEVHGALKEQGIKTHAWVVNTAEDLEKFAALGVDYVTSDRPDLLLATRR